MYTTANSKIKKPGVMNILALECTYEILGNSWVMMSSIEYWYYCLFCDLAGSIKYFKRDNQARKKMRFCVLHKYYGHNVVICTYVCAGCLRNKIRQKRSANFHKINRT